MSERTFFRIRGHRSGIKNLVMGSLALGSALVLVWSSPTAWRIVREWHYLRQARFKRADHFRQTQGKSVLALREELGE